MRYSKAVRCTPLALAVLAVPTTLFMTAEGELFYRWVGRLSQRGIEGLIEDMAIASQNDKRASAGG